MNLEKILAQYDAMFGKNSLAEIEAYLVAVIEEAKDKSEYGILVTMLNEIIGFCRDTTQKDKALKYCDDLQNILHEMHLEGRIDYATSLLNVANAYRAFGLFKESLELYKIVEQTYLGQVDETDFMYAGLYNNWSLLYQEMKEYENAREMLLKALAIADSYENAVIPQATTRANLAATLLQIGTEEAYQEAIGYLKEALEVHEKDGGEDFHYGAVLVAMGDAYSYKEDFENAAVYYKKGLYEIEKHVGKTDNYKRVLEKYEYVKAKCPKEDAWESNLSRCEQFYEKYGKPMIEEKFPEYADRIAVGLVGEGSDCFEFDDAISADHDYELGFCMWLTESDYEKIKDPLQEAYAKLLVKHTGQSGKELFLSARRGVFTIRAFYSQALGISESGLETIPFEKIDEYRLATAVNGKVFTDKLGEFTRMRSRLQKYYPESVWRKKIAQSLHEFSQYAQSNYARMMARNDIVTAKLCVGKALEAAMDLTYLLCKVYAPYYKWKYKGLDKLVKQGNIEFANQSDDLQQLVLLLREAAELPMQTEAWANVVYDASKINVNDKYIVTFEKIASVLLKMMKAQNLVAGEDTFLEIYISQILKGKNMDIIEKIVELEWKQFDKVKNEGGRAGCQDDYETFSIMRKSQYLTWDDDLLNSYCNDLLAAESKGWNLITEKYARMMESTAPEKYEELKKDLPDLSDERIAIQEEIIKIQVGWMEEFASQYPKMAGNARSIHTSEDTVYNTSYETYLRGEMGTYSENTFILYGRFITDLLKQNKNLALEIMKNTAKLYGYASVEEAESRID